MPELIAALLAWTVANTGYAAPPGPPNVEFQPSAFFEQACADAGAHCTARGFYRDGTGTIVLHDAYRDLAGPRERSLLVHELVHFLQDQSGQWGATTCEVWVEREHEAFRLQYLYLATNGGNPFGSRMPSLSPALCRDR
jgi:hypothetical protein